MKSILSTFIVTISCLILISCGGNNNGKSTKSDDIISESQDLDAKGGNVCLLDYQNKYDQLISVDEVLRLTGFEKEKLEVDYRKLLKDPTYHEYVMLFKNGRVGKLFGFEKEMEQPDFIKVRNIEDMSMKMFKYNYRVPTEEDIQATKQILADVVDGKIENENAEKILKKAEEKNISKETIKNTGSLLTNVFAEVNKAYIDVEHLGDAAAWNTKTFELVVLQNGVKFAVEANVSNDYERNKQIAISLAKIILDKCK